MVYHDHNCIISMGIGKSGDEIYRYRGEGEGVVDSQRGESRHCGMSVYLGCLTVGTSRNKSAEVGRHPRPPVVLLHAMESSEEPFVTPGGGVME